MREEVKADQALELTPRLNKNFLLLDEYWPSRYHKHDKDGFAVYYERLGAVDVRGLMNVVPSEELFNMHIYQQEQSRDMKAKMSQENNKSMYFSIVVQDLAGLSMSHIYTPGFDLFKRILHFDQSNYPHSLKAYYVINAPKSLTLIYSMIKPLIDPTTRKKVHILGSNYTDTLLEAIDKENLPAEYGGECKCEGGCIPGGGKFVDRKEDGTTYNPVEVSISRKDTHEVKLELDQGSVLSWNFTVKNHDVSFGIFYGNEARETCLEMTKQGGTQKGSLKADRSGTYVVVWDNTHSLLKSKTVVYQMFIEKET